jgi:hypothetical protein
MMSSPIFFDKKIHGCRDFLPIHRISQLFDVILRITTLAMEKVVCVMSQMFRAS